MRAFVFNNHLQTFGGGERVTFAAASVLAQRGIETVVVTTEKTLPSPEEIRRFFGPEFSGFALKQVQDREQLRLLAKDADIFINHTAGDETLNPCRLGLYFVMFPFQERAAFLTSYQAFLCNSSFTARHVQARWHVQNRAHVLYPPVDLHAGLSTKKKQIVVLGRFNRSGHDKNQLLLVDCFERFLKQGNADWKLLLIGKRAADADDPIPALKARLGALPVELHVDVDDATKRRLLGESALFWHGAGIGVDEAKDPARLEHFGIAVPEGMAAGAVPLVFARGGPAEIVAHGVTGFHFTNDHELVTLTDLVANDAALQARLRAAAIHRASDFSTVAFRQKLGDIVTTMTQRRT
jgi:glycosyltransferase involved in cell wall biosynthesis